MAFPLRASTSQPNFRPSIKSRDIRAQTTSAGPSTTAAPSGKGMPLWAGALLMYAAATPVYCHFNTQKQLKEGWARALAREAEAKAAALAASKPKGKKEVMPAEVIMFEAPKEVPAVVMAKPVAMAPATTVTTTEGNKKEERKWVKPAVGTVVGVSVGAAAIGAAAYYERKNKANKKA